MGGEPLYESDPSPAPDSEFEPGQLGHLVAGNHGRLLDSRRTPILVTRVIPERASFELEIRAFEDTGARWELPLEEIWRFQFARGSPVADPATVAGFEAVQERFAHDTPVAADPSARASTLDLIAAERSAVRGWLQGRAPGRSELSDLIDRREGDPAVFSLLEEYMAERGLAELEAGFSSTFVSNPASGEVVKGHAIVLAQLGLCPYGGRAVRDPELFSGGWSTQRRAQHITVRLAFVHELFSSWGHREATVYRGAAVEGPLPPRSAASFVSATFSRAVAEDHFAGGPRTITAVLWRQVVPVARLFMTFLETRAMNRRFKEAEAVLVGDPANQAF